MPVHGYEPPIGRLDIAAADALVNPRDPADFKSVANGEELYRIYCLPCHGATGMGDGPVSMTGEIMGPFAGVLPAGGHDHGAERRLHLQHDPPRRRRRAGISHAQLQPHPAHGSLGHRELRAIPERQGRAALSSAPAEQAIPGGCREGAGRERRCSWRSDWWRSSSAWRPMPPPPGARSTSTTSTSAGWPSPAWSSPSIFVIVGATWPGPVRHIAAGLAAWVPVTLVLAAIGFLGRHHIYPLDRRAAAVEGGLAEPGPAVRHGSRRPRRARAAELRVPEASVARRSTERPRAPRASPGA